jgi:hypothetical protein
LGHGASNAMRVDFKLIWSLKTALSTFYELQKVRATGEEWESTKIV